MKRLKFRRNIADLVDCDYLSKLTEEDREYMNLFMDEYYGTSYGKEGSLHKNLPDYEIGVKKQMQDMINSQNRCLSSIARCSKNLLVPLETLNDNIPDLSNDKTIEEALVTQEPTVILKNMIDDYTDQIDSGTCTNTAELLMELCLKSNHLFILVRKHNSKSKRDFKKS